MEFAIISVVFIMMIFGIIYLGIMLHTNATLQWAVENSVRSAVIAREHDADSNDDEGQRLAVVR